MNVSLVETRLHSVSILIWINVRPLGIAVSSMDTNMHLKILLLTSPCQRKSLLPLEDLGIPM